MKESHKRSLIKGISWRATGTVDTITISWLVTGNPFAALKIGAVEVITKIFLFYLHERVWGRVGWGKNYNNSGHDSHSRSFIKGISWRATGTVDTIFIAFLVLGHFPDALKIGGIEVVTKILLYYVHERVWSRIGWGRQLIVPVDKKIHEVQKETQASDL